MTRVAVPFWMSPANDSAKDWRAIEIISEIVGLELIAVESKIQELARLRRVYGPGRWRKMKGSPQFASPMAAHVGQKYTGTRPTA